MRDIETIIFDLDGTLYEDLRVYDRYAQELARFLPAETAEAYLEEWERAQRGESVAKVGMGYDLSRDLLFRFRDGRILAYVDWQGNGLPLPDDAPRQGDPDLATTAPGSPLEVMIFGPERLNIGDFWLLPDALAAHFGVPKEQRTQAFKATRACMASDAFHLRLEPEQDAMLEALQAAGKRLIVMSNAFAWTVDDVIDRLGIRHHFSLVVPDAGKPLGLTRFMEKSGNARRILAIGDTYVNDVEPVLHAGGLALFVDRHRTGAGEEFDTCYRVGSIEEATQWVTQMLSTGSIRKRTSWWRRPGA